MKEHLVKVMRKSPNLERKEEVMTFVYALESNVVSKAAIDKKESDKIGALAVCRGGGAGKIAERWMFGTSSSPNLHMFKGLLCAEAHEGRHHQSKTGDRPERCEQQHQESGDTFGWILTHSEEIAER